MKFSSTLTKISGPTLEVKKKSELIKGSQNIFAYWKESEQNEALANKLGLFQIQLGGLGDSTTPANKIVIYIRTFLFLENWQFNHKLCPPLSPTNRLCLKDSPHNLTKYEIKEGDFKNPNFPTL